MSEQIVSGTIRVSDQSLQVDLGVALVRRSTFDEEHLQHRQASIFFSHNTVGGSCALGSFSDDGPPLASAPERTGHTIAPAAKRGSLLLLLTASVVTLSALPAQAQVTVHFDRTAPALAGLSPASPTLMFVLQQYPSPDYGVYPVPTPLQSQFDDFWSKGRAQICSKLRASFQQKDHFGSGQSAHDVMCNLSATSSAAYIDNGNLGKDTISIKPALSAAYTDRTFGPAEVRLGFVVSGNEVDFNVTTDTALPTSDDPLLALSNFSLLVELTLAATSPTDIELNGRPAISVAALSAHVFYGTLSTKSLLPAKSALVDAVTALEKDDHTGDLIEFRAMIERAFADSMKSFADLGFARAKAIGLHGTDTIHVALVGGAAGTPVVTGPGRVSGAFWWRLSDLHHVTPQTRPKSKSAESDPRGRDSLARKCGGLVARVAVQAGEGAIWTNVVPTKPAGRFQLTSYSETNGRAVCSYEIDDLPESANLRVTPLITNAAFAGHISVAPATTDFFQIPSGGGAPTSGDATGRNDVARYAGTMTAARYGYIVKFPRTTRSKQGAVYDLDFAITTRAPAAKLGHDHCVPCGDFDVSCACPWLAKGERQ